MTANPCVLLVDDDRFVRVVLRDMLAPTGYRVVEAANGEEALVVFEAEKPSIVLIDLVMPKMSGLEAVARLHAIDPKIPLLVVSSIDAESLVLQALAAGAAGFVVKPFHPLEIIEAVQKLLGATSV